jgi:Fe-S cluster assembly protein SufD
MNTRTIIQDVTDGAHQFKYRVKENAKLTIVLTGLKIRKAEMALHINLAAPGATVIIIGIFVGGKSSDIRLNTTQVHQAPGTTSNLLVKSVLFDEATFTYAGSIRVEKNAQKTDAYQRNENLLIGIGTHATSNPSLEILANDVRCTHGSATGPINSEELWYLQSRGISLQSARQLIVEGYVRGAVNLVEDTRIRDQLWQKILSAI